MKNKIRITLLCILLVGCAGAELVNTNFDGAGGMIRYKNGNVVREESRELALKKISEFCKGRPSKIISEKFNPDVFSVQIGGTHYTSAKENYMYINFVCEN